MKIKVYVVDMEIPRRAKRWMLRLGLPVLTILGGLTIAYAAVPKVWTANEPLRSADLNANFDALDKRLAAVEAPAVTQQVPAGLIGMFAANCPTGWSPCNGTGTCPNLVGAYPKGGTAFAAQTGTNMHAHTVGTYATTSAGDHAHVVYLHWDNSGIWGSFGLTPVVWTSNASGAVTIANATGTRQDGNGVNTTTSGAHSHPITGTSQSVSHEPVHATVVFCMKN